MRKLPNIDRIREHQANERTFLAWVRTSIALIGFGFAIARFGLFLHQLHLTLTQQEPPPNSFLNSQNLGVSLVILGIVTIALAAWRYNQIFLQIEREHYQPRRWTVLLMALVVMFFGIISIPLLFLRSQQGLPPRSPIPYDSRNFR